jgi:electron transfer flavoprotein alpha subunit
LEDGSLELLAQGRQMADQQGWWLAGLLIGGQVSHLADQAIAQGAKEVWLAEDARLQNFNLEAYTEVAFKAILERKPGVFLVGATPDGRDLAGRLAVRLRTGLNADCTGLWMEDCVLVSEGSGFGGGVLALIQMRDHRPQMATVREGVFTPLSPDLTRVGDILHLGTDLTGQFDRVRVLQRVNHEGPNLRGASVLVAGGRGMEGDFALLHRLGDLLGGEVGATRPPVDEGKIVRERQVGQTGVMCSPKVALCCGISGAFHFLVGVEKAGLIISINSDPEAPIFEYSDYCIVGDIHTLLPALIVALQEAGEGIHV